MNNIWSGVGSYFTDLADKIHQYENDWQSYLYPDDQITKGGAAGYPSNVRHAAASSALSNKIANKLHGWFATLVMKMKNHLGCLIGVVSQRL